MTPTEFKPDDWEFYLTEEDLGKLLGLMKRMKTNTIYFSSHNLLELREDIDSIVYDKKLFDMKN